MMTPHVHKYVATYVEIGLAQVLTSAPFRGIEEGGIGTNVYSFWDVREDSVDLYVVPFPPAE